MEKRRVRLEINGVVCGLITQESDEYMESLADEVGKLIGAIQESSPYITREAAALTAALSYCDDLRKKGKEAFALQERVDELEVEAELWQEEKAEIQSAPPKQQEANPELEERLHQLETENTALQEQAGKAEEYLRRAQALEDENAALQKSLLTSQREAPQQEVEPKTEEKPKTQPVKRPRGKNPLRYEDGMEQEGFVSFFEKP